MVDNGLGFILASTSEMQLVDFTRFSPFFGPYCVAYWAILEAKTASPGLKIAIWILKMTLALYFIMQYRNAIR